MHPQHFADKTPQNCTLPFDFLLQGNPVSFPVTFVSIPLQQSVCHQASKDCSAASAL